MTVGMLPWDLIQQEIEVAIRDGFPGKKYIRSSVLADYLVRNQYSYFAGEGHRNAMLRVTKSVLKAGWERWNPSKRNCAPVWIIPEEIS